MTSFIINMPSPHRIRHALVLLALLSVALIGACGRKSEDAAAESAATAATPNVLTFTAAQVQHGGVHWAPVTGAVGPAALEVPGQLVPDADRTAQLGAPARGRVLDVRVQPGQRVRVGQALITLQSQEASTARADYDKATAELNSRRAGATYARAARERAERLLEAKAISRQELERAQADAELARASLAQAEAEVRRARAGMSQLGVGSANGVMVIASPLTGIVLSRDAVPGSVAEAGAPLVTVTDPATLWLEASVADRAASSLATGSRVRFAVPAFPTDTFDARVTSVGGALDPSTRTVPVRARVANGAGRLRPAMFATVWIEGAARQAAVSVPEAAVQLLNEGQVVFLATPIAKGGVRLELRTVTLGSTVGGRAQVLQGLTAGETIVTDGAFAVKSEFSRAKMAK